MAFLGFAGGGAGGLEGERTEPADRAASGSTNARAARSRRAARQRLPRTMDTVGPAGGSLGSAQEPPNASPSPRGGASAPTLTYEGASSVFSMRPQRLVPTIGEWSQASPSRDGRATHVAAWATRAA
mmetsp:Transcript_10839/g.30269  ORF Transcript_10839/g.30269 Transcript_10839/m.30269 type:complete len:127 (-) Transcript_10839:3-383(-)